MIEVISTIINILAGLSILYLYYEAIKNWKLMLNLLILTLNTLIFVVTLPQRVYASL